MNIVNKYPVDPEKRARVVRELDRYATRWGLSREELIYNVLSRWLEAMAADEKPKQLKLPTTDALNRLAHKVVAARNELLELAAKRHNPAPLSPTPERIM